MYLMPLNSTIILDEMNELIQHAAWERFWFQGMGKSYYSHDLNTKMFQFFSELGLYPANWNWRIYKFETPAKITVKASPVFVAPLAEGAVVAPEGRLDKGILYLFQRYAKVHCRYTNGLRGTWAL
ncbi:uncharacterized protein ASPGLDRAFT_791703 [Aspergillus glaucus CBS 516.65]|uniref:Uncharacterized protein n=1 Tax=Aspergillus glaucus CBS 516.65 TaxID=1160497 RepID=A0A1L9VA85_ASPGL|nr:hypothetical protein ASPGLDRAFT_791703 [Aspergillus glaucus CBS 516.65]OJJ80841.1 hypothetical protein ASPGLDRAFT_791703 [Aspergillus glaucus CBS 516.65]